MDNFEAIIGRLMLTHAQLKVADPKLLSEGRRKERLKQMRELRKVIEQVVGLRYNALSVEGKLNAKQLDKTTSELNETLTKMKTSVQVIKTIGAALGVIVNLVGLIV